MKEKSAPRSIDGASTVKEDSSNSEEESSPDSPYVRVLHAFVSLPQEPGDSHAAGVKRLNEYFSENHPPGTRLKDVLYMATNGGCKPDAGQAVAQKCTSVSAIKVSESSLNSQNVHRSDSRESDDACNLHNSTKAAPVPHSDSFKSDPHETYFAGEDSNDCAENESTSDSISDCSDDRVFASELEDSDEPDDIDSDDAKVQKKFKSAYEFPTVFGALKRGFLNKNVDISPMTRRKAASSSGAEGPSVTASSSEDAPAAGKLLKKKGSLAVYKENGATNGEGRGQSAVCSEAVQSFRAKYKYMAGGVPRHLFYRRASTPKVQQSDDQLRDMVMRTQEQRRQEYLKEKQEKKEAWAKQRKARQDADGGSIIDNTEPELAEELAEKKKQEREAELRVLAVERARMELEKFDEEVGLCRAVNTDRCPNASRTIHESSKRLELRCTEGCFVLFHFQSCWRDFEKKFHDNKNNSDWKMVRGAMCVTPDCHGKIIKAQTREKKRVVHEYVEEMKKDKKLVSAPKELSLSKSGKLDKRSKSKAKDLSSTTLENGGTVDQEKIARMTDLSSSEPFERRGGVEVAGHSTASTSSTVPLNDGNFAKDGEPGGVGQESALMTMLPAMPLQVYKREVGELVVTVKEAKRKTKSKKWKALKAKKVHLFRDGFTLPSTDEPEDEFDPALFELMARNEFSDRVWSPLNPEPEATEFPPLSAGLSSGLTKSKSNVLLPFNVLEEASLLVDPEQQEEIQTPHLLVENVHQKVEDAEIRDLFAQSGTVIHVDVFASQSIATVSMGSQEEAVTARKTNHQRSYRGLKLKCTHFLLERLPPDIFQKAEKAFEETSVAHGDLPIQARKDETESHPGQPTPAAQSNRPAPSLSPRPGSPTLPPGPAATGYIRGRPGPTLLRRPVPSPTPPADLESMPSRSSTTLSSTPSLGSLPRGPPEPDDSTLLPVSMLPFVSGPPATRFSTAYLVEKLEGLKGSSTKSSGTTLRVTAKPFVLGAAVCTVGSNEESLVGVSNTLSVVSTVVDSPSADLTAPSVTPAGLKPTSTDSAGSTPSSVNSADIALPSVSSLGSCNLPKTPLVHSNSSSTASLDSDQSSNPRSLSSLPINPPLAHSDDFNSLSSYASGRNSPPTDADFNPLPMISMGPTLPYSHVNDLNPPVIENGSGRPTTSNSLDPHFAYSSGSNQRPVHQTSYNPPPPYTASGMVTMAWNPAKNRYSRPQFSEGFSAPAYGTTNSRFGQVIGCNNETLAMYKQMGRFCVSTKHLLGVPHIAPGTCTLFIYNIVTQQMHGVYQSSSYGLQAMPGALMQSMLVYAPSVGFDTVEDYVIPLTSTELESVHPGASRMSGRPVYLFSHQVAQLTSLFEEKNKAQHSNLESAMPMAFERKPLEIGMFEEAIPPSVALSFPVDIDTPALRIPLSQLSGIPLLETGGPTNESHVGTADLLGGLTNSRELATLEIIGASERPASIYYAGNPQPSESLSPTASTAPLPLPGLVLPSPPLTSNAIAESRLATSILELENTVQVAAPEVKESPQLSPMELFPHLFPKEKWADLLEPATRVISYQPNDRKYSSPYKTQNFETGSSTLDLHPEQCNHAPVPEFSRFLLPRPKQVYNPLAFEQDREKQQLELSKAPVMVPAAGADMPLASPTTPDLSLCQDILLGASTGLTSHLLNIPERVEPYSSSALGVPIASSSSSLLFPCLYEVVSPSEEHRIRERPNKGATEIGLFSRGALIEAWGQSENWLRVKFPPHPEAWSMAYDEKATYLQRNDEMETVATPIPDTVIPRRDLAPLAPASVSSMHVQKNAITSGTEAAPMNRANLCCYCYERPADHLILDCRHLGPCVECKDAGLIEVCGQPNCGTRVKTMMRIHL